MLRLALLWIALAACGLAGAETTKIVVEAEHYGMLVPHMAKVKDAAASGGWCIQAPPVSGPDRIGSDTDPGYVAYRVRVPVDGVYRLFARCYWPWEPLCVGNATNSFFLRIGEYPPTVIGQDVTVDKWHWVKGPIRELTAAEHVIVFRYREAAAKLDQFLLTTSSVVPVRAETETPQYLVPPPE